MNTKLIEELKKPAYQQISDQAAANLINVLTVTIRKPVELWKVEQHASRKGYRAKLEIAATDSSHPYRELAINILEFIKSRRLETIDMDNPDVRKAFENMTACEFATQQDVAELIAMGDVRIRWVDHIGFGTAGDGHIRSAREIIANAIT